MFRTGRLGKKGTYDIAFDIFIFIIFILFLLLFTAWSHFAQQEEGDRLNTEFSGRDADTILLGLMRTVVEADLDLDGEADTETMADLIGLTDDDSIIEERVSEALNNLCIDDEGKHCRWIFKIDELNVEVDSRDVEVRALRMAMDPSAARLSETFPNEAKSIVFIPTNRLEVLKVEFILRTK